MTNLWIADSHIVWFVSFKVTVFCSMKIGPGGSKSQVRTSLMVQTVSDCEFFAALHDQIRSLNESDTTSSCTCFYAASSSLSLDPQVLNKCHGWQQHLMFHCSLISKGLGATAGISAARAISSLNAGIKLKCKHMSLLPTKQATSDHTGDNREAKAV